MHFMWGEIISARCPSSLPLIINKGLLNFGSVTVISSSCFYHLNYYEVDI